MDISEIGLVISVVSVAGAVVKQSFDMKKFSNPNGKYVKREDCHEAMKDQTECFDKKFDDLKGYMKDRFDDLKDLINK